MIREAIKAKLQAKQLTAYKLAKDLQINYSNLCLFLRGGKSISIETLEKIFVYLKIKLK